MKMATMRKRSNRFSACSKGLLRSEYRLGAQRISDKELPEQRITTFITIKIVAGDGLVSFHEHICTSTLRVVKNKCDV